MWVAKSIFYKYVLAFISMIVIPVIIIGVMVDNSLKDQLVTQKSQGIKETLQQTSIGLDQQLKDMSMTLATLSQTEELLSRLSQWNETTDGGQKYLLSQDIDQRLSTIFHCLDGVETFVFCFKDQGYYYYGNPPTVKENNFRTTQWYQETINNDNKVSIISSLDTITSSSSRHDYLSGAIHTQSSVSHHQVELIYMAIRTDLLIQLRDNRLSQGHVLLLDNNLIPILPFNNQEILANEQQFIQQYDLTHMDKKSIQVQEVKGVKSMIVASPVGKARWSIVSIMDFDVITAAIKDISKRTIFIAVMVLCLFFIFSMVFFANIITPIKKLLLGMKKVEKGNLTTVVEVKGVDEMAQLAKGYNKMILEIKMLMKERDLKERQRSKAELEALQSQINPHFVANTLNSIRFMAMIAKVDSIRDMTSAFINIVSSAFNRRGAYTTVAKEIKLLQDYVYIMNVKHGNRYQVTFFVEQVVKNYYLLKMLIQPLMENAILHGISDLDYKGKISVHIYPEGQKLIVTVEDNGKGIDHTEEKEGFTGIGLHNVRQRIKLNHDEYGDMIMTGREGEGTKVKMILPLIKENPSEVIKDNIKIS